MKELVRMVRSIYWNRRLKAIMRTSNCYKNYKGAAAKRHGEYHLVHDFKWVCNKILDSDSL